MRPRDLDRCNEDMVEPQQASFHSEGLLLPLVGKHLPPSRRRTIVHKTASTGDCDEPAICAQGRISDRPVRGHVALWDLDVLPDIRLGVDDAHIGLVGTAIDKNAVVHLQKCILRVVLYLVVRNVLYEYALDWKPTGDCCPVVALFATGRMNNCPSGSLRGTVS